MPAAKNLKRGGRPTNRTKKRDDTFFEQLAKGVGVVAAAKAACYNRRTVYDYRDKDEEFLARWEDAIAEHVETLEIEADRRAREGVEEPVFYQGVECGTVRKYSDTLLMFRLKGLAPDKYRERRELMGKDGGPIETATTFTSMVLSEIDGQTRSK